MLENSFSITQRARFAARDARWSPSDKQQYVRVRKGEINQPLQEKLVAAVKPPFTITVATCLGLCNCKASYFIVDLCTLAHVRSRRKGEKMLHFAVWFASLLEYTRTSYIEVASKPFTLFAHELSFNNGLKFHFRFSAKEFHSVFHFPPPLNITLSLVTLTVHYVVFSLSLTLFPSSSHRAIFSCNWLVKAHEIFKSYTWFEFSINEVTSLVFSFLFERASACVWVSVCLTSRAREKCEEESKMHWLSVSFLYRARFLFYIFFSTIYTYRYFLFSGNSQAHFLVCVSVCLFPHSFFIFPFSLCVFAFSSTNAVSSKKWKSSDLTKIVP